MRVLLVNSVCGIGSTGRICTDLYENLTLEGHDCVIAYGRGSSTDFYKTYKIGSKIENYFHVFKTRIFDRHGFSSNRATKKFIIFIKNYNPDVIHIHNVHGYYLNIELFFDYLKNEYEGKIIWTMHDCWAFSPHSAYIDLDSNNQLPISEENNKMKKYPKSLLFNNSKKNYQDKVAILKGIPNMIIISPSEWLKGLIKISFLREYKCQVINNGIERDSFFKDELTSQSSEKKIVLGVANIWEERKGLVFFNELCENLSEDYEIVLIGKSNDSLNSRIIHIEQTNSVDELRYWYNKAFCLLNPTLEDNYPTTNLESISCGTPVIGFDTGGNKEVISNNYGIITKEKTTKSLLESILFLNDNKEKYFIDIDKNTFSKKNMYIEYMKLY